MPLPPDDIRARLAQLRSEFAMRAALQSEYDKEMSGKYIHEMIPFADWLAQRNAPTGKAKGGLVWNSPDWKPHPENDLLQPIGASRMIGDERLLSQDDTFSHGLSEFPSSKKSYRYLYHGEDNKPIGAMQIQTAGPRSKKAVIQNLYVAEANRRQGIASKLLDRAREDFDVKHSTDLTTAGRAFARAKKASGGSVPSLDVMRLAIGGQGPRNWLKGSVEKVIDPLKSKGNWDQPESYLKASQNPLIGPATRAQLEDAYRDSLRHQSINQWVERNLGNYIRKQLGHPNDPIRKLAEEGVLHTDPTRVEIIGGDNDMGTHANRRREMFGGQKMAKGPLAQAWEDAVDTRFEGYKIKDLQGMPEMHEGQYEPWMDKADPNTLIFEPYAFDELGFDHIVDILKEDLAQGRIRPEQLSKVSIEQAVRRAHQYDQERKKAMAQTALKATEGMPVHKDYGDGFKWIELTKPENVDESEYSHLTVAKPQGRKDFAVMDKNTDRLVSTGHKNPESAIEHIKDIAKEKKLADALKYEGDTMGHCVGGYCPDVSSGQTRIFSLRDAKNEPHVTIEVKPPKYSDAPREHRIQYLDELKQQDPNADWSDEGFAKWMKNRGIELPPAIKQIKGKSNAKPKQDYIPYVQDFVKSGNWSDVDELRNADMHHAGNLYTNNERKNLERLTGEKMDYVAQQDIPRHRELLKQNNVQPLLPDNKADGGEVDAEEVFMGKGGKVKELEQYLRQREGEYGVKRLQRAFDEIPGLENMYTLDALKRAFGGDNAQALMTMDPAEFERYAVRLFDPNDYDEDEYADESPHGNIHEYIQQLAKIKGGFADVPFLEVGRRKPELLPSIEGHEGRHRSRALAGKGVKKSLVQLFPTGRMREPMPRRYREDFIEAMKKELGEKRLVTPEGRSLLPADLTAQEHRNLENRNLVASNRPQLPEIYKDGGDVDAESVFFPKSKE